MTAFHNRIRIPIKINKPQFPVVRQIYEKSNGDSVVQSAVVKKTYEGITEYMSERLHERTVIALQHDFVQIETENYYGRITPSNDYQINWLDFKTYPIAQAKFQVKVTPFNATNSNCQTCEDATQVITNDDSFYADLNENTNYTLDVAANDEICCFPVTWTITSFNTDYLDSATIDSTGTIHIHTKTGLVAINGVNLLTYRATCQNGSYDESDVFANINGTIPGCLAPTSVFIDSVVPTSARLHWTEPSPLPNHYHIRLWDDSTHTYVQTDNVTTGITGYLFLLLNPGRDYIAYIRSQCDATDNDSPASNYIAVAFTTPPETSLCGSYSISYDDPSAPGAGVGGHVNITYMDCNGVLQDLYVPNSVQRTVCAMQTAPGSPTYITNAGNPHVTITYLHECV